MKAQPKSKRIIDNGPGPLYFLAWPIIGAGAIGILMTPVNIFGPVIGLPVAAFGCTILGKARRARFALVCATCGNATTAEALACPVCR